MFDDEVVDKEQTRWFVSWPPERQDQSSRHLPLILQHQRWSVASDGELILYEGTDKLVRLGTAYHPKIQVELYFVNPMNSGLPYI
jgi:hypothetical protein